MSHYSLLFNTIAGHIKTAWNVETTTPGRAPKQILQLPRAVVTLDNCERTLAGRSVEQVWNFTIAGQFALPSSSVDSQELMNDKAEALIDLLTPFNENTPPPAVPAKFGTVGYLPFVNSWDAIPLDDADNSVAVELSFSVRTTVWQ